MMDPTHTIVVVPQVALIVRMVVPGSTSVENHWTSGQEYKTQVILHLVASENRRSSLSRFSFSFSGFSFSLGFSRFSFSLGFSRVSFSLLVT